MRDCYSVYGSRHNDMNVATKPYRREWNKLNRQHCKAQWSLNIEDVPTRNENKSFTGKQMLQKTTTSHIN
jgi:hypothetical protein